MFKLQIKKSALKEWANRHPSEEEHHVVTVLPIKVKARGYFTKAELQEYCRWKSPRTAPRVAENSAEYVEAVTRTALSTPNEKLRIEILTLLNGVSWPSASVLLHFGHKDPYPILDFRALWTLGVDASKMKYNFDLWWEYTKYCRGLAKETGLSMRMIDLALWQYSKENQNA